MKSATSLALALAAVLMLGPATTLGESGNAADDDLMAAVTQLQLALELQSEILRRLLETKHFGPRCPYPFSSAMDECFFVSNFKLGWHEARRHCLGMGADLAMRTRLFALRIFVLQEHFRSGYIWMGSTDEEAEGEWKWLDGETIDEDLWVDGQPNNANGNQHCLLMGVPQIPFFYDAVCSSANYFACHYKRGGSETK